MIAKSAVFACAAFGFLVALLEPRGAEPTLPEPICLAMALLSLALAGIAAARGIGEHFGPPSG